MHVQNNKLINRGFWYPKLHRLSKFYSLLGYLHNPQSPLPTTNLNYPLDPKLIRPIGHTPNIANHVFCHLKNIWLLNFIFFNFIQLSKLSAAYFCRFFGKKYFTSSDPFFVMYNDRCKSFIIRAVGDNK